MIGWTTDMRRQPAAVSHGGRADTAHHGHFVSAVRVLTVLRQRLGCTPAGYRDPDCEYWTTPRGARFRVADPHQIKRLPHSSRTTGRRSLCYSYEYAAALLHHVSSLVDRERPRPERPKADDRSPRGRPVPDSLTPAVLRQRAREHLTAAQHDRNSATRKARIVLADQYEQLADAIEDAARKPPGS